MTKKSTVGGKPAGESGKRGRPPSLVADEKTLNLIEGLGKIQATQEEAASVLRVSRDTFFEFMKNEPDARDRWEMGQSAGKASLRRKQFELAMNGNATMLIWCGKQILGQKDKVEHGGPGGGAIPVEHSFEKTSAAIAGKLARIAATSGAE